MMSNEEIWERTAKALDGGDFTLLDILLADNDASIIHLLETNGEPIDAMNEAFTWACFTDRTADAEALLDKGVDPAAGDKTGLAGYHWAANRGNLETVKLLIKRNAPLEQINMYGGTVLGCALYSVIHEYRDTHAEIIEMLIEAGAYVDPAAPQWWEDQNVLSPETKERVRNALEGAKPDRNS